VRTASPLWLLWEEDILSRKEAKRNSETSARFELREIEKHRRPMLTLDGVMLTS
jgi:hypothetical protein